MSIEKQNSSLWKHSNFLKLWFGQTISMLGSQVTYIALPLTAVLILNATPVQMGAFQAVSTAPFFILGLFAGAWIDRVDRLPLLVYTNIASVIILSFVPILAWFNLLSIWLLYIVAFLSAASTMTFQLAYQSFLPSIIKKENLPEGNSKLEGSRTVTQVLGPSMAGVLIQLITAPIAILVDIISFIISACFFSNIKVTESKPQIAKQNIWLQIFEGLKVIISNPFLRSISFSTAILNFSRSAFEAVYLLFVVKTLSLNPAQIGMVYGFGSMGSLLGAVIANRIAKRFGIGASIVGSCVLIGIGFSLVSFASDSLFLSIPLLILAQAFTGMGNTVYFINQVSLRQAITPNNLLGRVNASQIFISRSAMPLGGVLGGIIGSCFGLRFSIAITSIFSFLAVLLLISSPVRRVRILQDLPLGEKK
ncbi:MAG: MFS transporter [Paenibacillaceae bacterium]